MSRNALVAKLLKLEAITVERGASEAEAATAALLAQRLIRQLAGQGDPDVTSRAGRYLGLSPGVHVRIGKARPLP
jgi:hypothetical protein